jgi:hypothetical protein
MSPFLNQLRTKERQMGMSGKIQLQHMSLSCLAASGEVLENTIMSKGLQPLDTP